MGILLLTGPGHDGLSVSPQTGSAHENAFPLMSVQDARLLIIAQLFGMDENVEQRRVKTHSIAPVERFWKTFQLSS